MPPRTPSEVRHVQQKFPCPRPSFPCQLLEEKFQVCNLTKQSSNPNCVSYLQGVPFPKPVSLCAHKGWPTPLHPLSHICLRFLRTPLQSHRAFPHCHCPHKGCLRVQVPHPQQVFLLSFPNSELDRTLATSSQRNMEEITPEMKKIRCDLIRIVLPLSVNFSSLRESIKYKTRKQAGCLSVIPSLRRWKQEDCGKLEASLRYIVPSQLGLWCKTLPQE